MTTPAPAPAGNPKPRLAPPRTLGTGICHWFLPLLLLFTAYFFYGGDLGKWRDDYFQCSIDPATGSAPLFTMPWDIRPEFWRPIHLFIVFNLGTWLWEHDALRHLITLGAAMLAIVSWHRFYRRATGSPLGACLGASLLAFFPMAFEVAFWPAAISTALCLALMALVLSIAHGAPRAPRPARRLIWLAPLAFLGACLNEQPIAGLAPIGLVVIAGQTRGVPRTRSLRLAIIGTLWTGLGCLAYVIPFLATRNPTKRGGLDTLASARDIPTNFVDAAREWFDLSLGAKATRFVDVGWTQATPVLRANLWLVALVLVATPLWLIVRTRPDPKVAPPSAAHPPTPGASPLWLLAFASLSAAAMLLPISILTDHSVAPRMTYPGAAMLALMLSTLAGTALARAKRRPAAVRAIVAFAAVTIAFTGAGALLGMQHVQHLRAQRDGSVLSELRRLAPSPVDRTAFVPIEIQSGLRFTRDPNFNAHNAGLFGRRYCAQPALRRAYQSPDLLAGAHTIKGEGAFVPLPSGRIILNELKGSAGGASPVTVPADHTIPFIVDADGRVRLVARLFVERADHNDFILDFPLAQGLAAAAGETPVTLARGPSTQPREPVPVLPLIPLDDWVLAPGASLVGAGHASPLTRRPGAPARAAIGARVQPGEVFQHLATHAVPPAAFPRRVLVRASAANVPPGSVLEVRWVIPERSDQLLGSLVLTPERVEAEPRWFPVRFNIAPGESPLTLRVEARLRSSIEPSGAARPVQVWVTPGFVQSLAPGAPTPALPDASPAAPDPSDEFDRATPSTNPEPDEDDHPSPARPTPQPPLALGSQPAPSPQVNP